MNLHDWIDEVCDLLDIEAEADEALLADLAEVAVDNVHGSAGPVTAFLLGVATGSGEADPDRVEQLAGQVQALAEAWDRPAGAADETDDDPEADSLVDAAGVERESLV
ncbi:molybdopterin-guanine dinucleotide biosynthesis protein MobA [Nocardioides sp. BGMRC 2183]|nr:molybdopterin-guanine dinucleotide biosynthesis protein MobA [Nocardioides sp. BGMRC 2183]